MLAKAALPVFLSVTTWEVLRDPTAWLGNDNEGGDTTATGVDAMAAAPVPVRATVRLPPERLLATVKVPVRLPVVVGLKVTFTVQLAASDDAHVVDSAKSPLIDTTTLVNAVVPA